jgi:hypothetical protein
MCMTNKNEEHAWMKYNLSGSIVESMTRDVLREAILQLFLTIFSFFFFFNIF